MAKGIIEQYNDLYKMIQKAKTSEDMAAVYPMIKSFVSQYEAIDNESTSRIHNTFRDKMQNMLEENNFVYERMNNRINEIRSRQYDYANEKYDSEAVQNKTLYLMASLPKERTTSNANKIKKILNDTIASGMVGSRAVLELMKYPAYEIMLDDNTKQHALIGSKSEMEKAFDHAKEKEMKEVEQALTYVYMQGFRLRKLNEKVTNTKTIFDSVLTF